MTLARSPIIDAMTRMTHMIAMSNPAVLADRLEGYRLEVQGGGRDGGR